MSVPPPTDQEVSDFVDRLAAHHVPLSPELINLIVEGWLRRRQTGNWMYHYEVEGGETS